MLFITGDLHFGHNVYGDQAVRKLAEYTCGKSTVADVLCLCGDIGSGEESLNEALELFRDFRGTKCAVLGNHDIWVFDESDSLAQFDRGHKIMKDQNFHPLDESPLYLDDFAIVGSMGWYDYSFKDENLGINRSFYADKIDPYTKQLIWNDALYVKWNYSDTEAAEYFADKLDKHLAETRGRQVIAIMHHLPTKKLLFHPRWLVPKSYRFTNAFLGSEIYAGIFTNHEHLTNVFCGHAHMSRSASIKGQTFTCVGGNYSDKELIEMNGKHIRRIAIKS